jgi:hypothetical protein
MGIVARMERGWVRISSNRIGLVFLIPVIPVFVIPITGLGVPRRRLFLLRVRLVDPPLFIRRATLVLLIPLLLGRALLVGLPLFLADATLFLADLSLFLADLPLLTADAALLRADLPLLGIKLALFAHDRSAVIAMRQALLPHNPTPARRLTAQHHIFMPLRMPVVISPVHVVILLDNRRRRNLVLINHPLAHHSPRLFFVVSASSTSTEEQDAHRQESSPHGLAPQKK